MEETQDSLGNRNRMENAQQNDDGEAEMVKIQSGKHNFYLDGYLKSNLEVVKHSVTKKDFDSFIVVTGREGFGKSSFAGQVATFLDPTFNLNRCCFTFSQFVEACRDARKFEAVVFDETMGALSSRGAMSRFNRELVKLMSEMRSKNLFVILCIPNFFELDRYPAIHRSTGLIHIYKRGRFGSYDYPTKKKLYLLGKKFYSYSVSPNFIGSFVKYFVYDKEKYESKKQQAISSWAKQKGKEETWLNQRNILIKKCFQDGIKTTELSELVGLSLRSVQAIVQRDASSHT